MVSMRNGRAWGAMAACVGVVLFVGWPQRGAMAQGAAPAGGFAAQVSTVRIVPDDDQLTVQDDMDCAAGSGFLVTRCVEHFTDQARFGQTDLAMVYQVTQAGDFGKLMAQVQTTLSAMPNVQVIEITQGFTLQNEDKSKSRDLTMSCDQGITNAMLQSYAVCLTPLSDTVVVAVAIFPGQARPSFNMNDLPDIDRAETLESEAVLSVNEATGVGL
jgi:hypothetical protein